MMYGLIHLAGVMDMDGDGYPVYLDYVGGICDGMAVAFLLIELGVVA